MSAGAPRFVPYAWRGGEEWILVRGPEDGPQLILLPPLFEEMNFTRTLLAEIGRGLAARGIGSWLPDLPGTGESLRPLASLGWDDWLDAVRTIGDAVAARIGGNPLSCAFRGGALLDHAIGARARWRYAPADGEALLRHMYRAQRIADEEGVASGGAPGTVELVGYRLSTGFVEQLRVAKPTGAADREPPAAPGLGLWRLAEPGRDDMLAQSLTADICSWVEACVSR